MEIFAGPDDGASAGLATGAAFCLARYCASFGIARNLQVEIIHGGEPLCPPGRNDARNAREIICNANFSPGGELVEQRTYAVKRAVSNFERQEPARLNQSGGLIDERRVNLRACHTAEKRCVRLVVSD